MQLNMDQYTFMASKERCNNPPLAVRRDQPFWCSVETNTKTQPAIVS